MSRPDRWSVAWNVAGAELCAREPTAAEIAAAAEQLAAWYNEAHNRAMMANTVAMSTADVHEHFAKVEQDGGRAFLLYLDGQLMGDADLRHLDPQARTGEFAILIGERQVQGRGLGTRFALILHALAFARLGLRRIYVSIIPQNRGSLRLFEKLGYEPDGSPAARAYIDQPDDVTLSMCRDQFLRLHGEFAAELQMNER
jgi:RimJ/RimL family protein N-acetyltransferase